MHSIIIKFNTVDSVQSFVNKITAYDNCFDLVSGRYRVNAKSIMGIFSLDLSKPLTLVIYNDDCENIIKNLSNYIYE